MQREWIEQQQKTQGVQEVAWPEHIYENFFVVVSSLPGMHCTSVAAWHDVYFITNPPFLQLELVPWPVVLSRAQTCSSQCLSSTHGQHQAEGLFCSRHRLNVFACVCFCTQGLPPDMELTQVAEQLCGEHQGCTSCQHTLQPAEKAAMQEVKTAETKHLHGGCMLSQSTSMQRADGVMTSAELGSSCT